MTDQRTNEVWFVRESDGICMVCNPVSLADFETEVITARAPNSKRMVSLCYRCIVAFTMAAGSQDKTPAIDLHPEVMDCAKALVRGIKL